jgi:hypothetical protein
MGSEALHTIPLLRLFPGLPKRTFSSLICFLGGILFFAYVRLWAREGGRDRRVMLTRSCASNAGPAASSEIGRKEELKWRLIRRRGGVLATCDTDVANRRLLCFNSKDRNEV